MTGKFINTEYKDTINSLVDGMKDRLKNPYYRYNDKKATIVDYYHINEKMSTLDEGTRNIFSPTGEDSPLKFNLIHDMYLYGVSRIDVDLEFGDFGIESNNIGGDCVVLPNTFEPLPNDYFVINHHEKRLLFKVTGVTPDTLENGANLYKITYLLDRLDDSDILKNHIVEEYNMVINNVGTQFNSIIRTTDYDFIIGIETLTTRLKTYYENLFFVEYLQTFVFEYNSFRFYDPFLIEFIRRNNILGGADKYIFVDHQTELNKTFSIDYDKNYLRSIELGDKNYINNPVLNGVVIQDACSLMTMRYEKYYKVILGGNSLCCYLIPMVDQDILDHIISNTLYEVGDLKEFYNVLISYFNKIELTQSMIDAIYRIDYLPNIDLFYNIPILIYVLENRIKELLK